MNYRCIILFILACFIHSSAAANAVTSVAFSIPFEKTQGLMLIKAELNGQKGLVVFDTGADAMIVNDALQTQNKGAHFTTLSGTIEVAKYKVERFKIGNFEIKDIDVFSTDLTAIEQFAGRKLLGIVGTKFFESEVLYIDNINNVIQLLDREAVMSHNVVGKQFVKSKIWLEDGVPLIPVTIGGKEYKFGLDTGASASVVNSKLLEGSPEEFVMSDIKLELLTADSNSNIKSAVYQVDELSISKLKIKDIQFGVSNFQEVNYQLDIKIDGIISLGQLPINEIYIDFKSEQILFQI